MRLLNVRTLELHSFTDKTPPPYVTLSHRWCDEISYEDFIGPGGKQGPGYEKIEGLCRFVATRTRNSGGFLPSIEFAWIDTVCIDKRNSAELAEALNSMSDWYFKCAYCVAYLSDVPCLASGKEAVLSAIDHSEWFRRGWTLQELLFPSQVIFCNRAWEQIGVKKATRDLSGAAIDDGPSLSGRISRITTIPKAFLYDVRLVFEQSVARRMSWAARRITTRAEDAAYCLMGIFKINMPLLYGEGSNAFIRLQQEIIKQTDDETVFAWTTSDFKWLERWSLLASHPHQFLNCGDIHRMQIVPRAPYRIANQYLELQSEAIRLAIGDGNIYLLELNCCIIPHMYDYCDVDDFYMNTAPAKTCLIAIHEHQNGKFHRILHGSCGQELVTYIKRSSPRAEVSSVESRLFVIALTASVRKVGDSVRVSDAVLQAHSFPALVRLQSFFGTTTNANDSFPGQTLAVDSDQAEDERRSLTEEEWT